MLQKKKHDLIRKLPSFNTINFNRWVAFRFGKPHHTSMETEGWSEGENSRLAPGHSGTVKIHQKGHERALGPDQQIMCGVSRSKPTNILKNWSCQNATWVSCPTYAPCKLLTWIHGCQTFAFTWPKAVEPGEGCDAEDATNVSSRKPNFRMSDVASFLTLHRNEIGRYWELVESFGPFSAFWSKVLLGCVLRLCIYLLKQIPKPAFSMKQTYLLWPLNCGSFGST